MPSLKANVGRITIGSGVDEHELAYCEGIEIDYDYNAIKHFAADRQFPVYVAHGNSELTITIDCAEFTASEAFAFETIAQSGAAVNAVLLAGYRGGGIPATTFTNCVVVQYTVTSRQGDVVKARVILSKQSDT
ncbi:hypothetical protein LCGC14_0306310 [marine sediment metagenome]|uniref:Uncharacterized protein n=1 Tax=marine sediment metagenome TaxID=412755 RepID=A0A0F9U698_9ZZZZ